MEQVERAVMLDTQACPAPPAVILAGGRASRMGGGDKGLCLLGGQPILARLIARMSAQCGPVALNANGDPVRFAGFGLPVLSDPLPGQPGPLAGLLAGMEWAAQLGAAHLVSAAADTPFIPADLVARLWRARAGTGLALAATRDGVGLARHPTFGIWPVALRDDLRGALRDGRRGVMAFADAHGAGTAEFTAAPVDPFFNINTPGDLAEARRLIASGSAG